MGLAFHDPKARRGVTKESLQSEAVCEDYRNGNEEVIEAAAQSWAERGEAHRSLAFTASPHAALKKVAYAPPPLESWCRH